MIIRKSIADKRFNCCQKETRTEDIIQILLTAFLFLNAVNNLFLYS